MDGIKILQTNRKARFNYSIEETLECGIALAGTEVKSIKLGKISFGDAYCTIEKDELWLISLHISPYVQGNIHNHQETRPRKLLAHKKEILRLQKKIQERGFTLVPTKVYLKNGYVKVEIGLGKGKKLHDKRETIKARDQQKEVGREMRNRY